MKMNKILAGVLLGISLLGCYQSDPPMLNTNTDDFGRVGDSVRFAGRDWKVKIYENQKWGPGPNYFSGNPNDIYLHRPVPLLALISKGRPCLHADI